MKLCQTNYWILIALMKLFQLKQATSMNVFKKLFFKTCEFDWTQLYHGVLQGTISGPLVFNIYVNNMIEHIHDWHFCTIGSWYHDIHI